MKNLLLTGEIQVGKSSLIKKSIANLDIKIGGYYTDRIIIKNELIFIFKSYSDENIILPFAKIDHSKKTKEINYDVFESKLVNILKNDLNHSDLIILDELGFMEEKIISFTNTIDEVLNSNTKVLGVLKKYDSPFLNNIKNREDTIILEVNPNNRDFLIDDINNFIK